MRVLEGQYRRKFLRSANSLRVRPTARRLREILFTVLAQRIEGASFLDLCAGSGAVGIEALSRGASFATFVDRSPKMCRFIEANLAACGVPAGRAEIWMSDATHFLRRVATERDQPWDIAFFDPPYAAPYAPVLEALGDEPSALRERGGLLVVEHSCHLALPEAIGALARRRVIRQGVSCLSFYERKK